MHIFHDDVIKWKHFPRHWPFVRGIHRSSVNSPYKGQWRGALMFSLIYARINGWVNTGEAGDLRRHHVHYDVIVTNRMFCTKIADIGGCEIAIIFRSKIEYTGINMWKACPMMSWLHGQILLKEADTFLHGKVITSVQSMGSNYSSKH